MGTSGIGLFSDDTARDVKRDFVALLRGGASAEEATRRLKRDASRLLQDMDEGPIFWLALAATQWDYGCLDDEVKQLAIEVIDTGAGLDRWSGKALEKRRAVLAILRDKLLSTQPKAKRPRKRKPDEPVPSYSVASPDGLGRATAFQLPGAPFMQVMIQREVMGQRGGGSVFVADCDFDQVEIEWLPGPVLQITYPAGVSIQQQKETHFYLGEIIGIVYKTKTLPAA